MVEEDPAGGGEVGPWEVGVCLALWKWVNTLLSRDNGNATPPVSNTCCQQNNKMN